MNAITLRFFLVYDLVAADFARGIAAVTDLAAAGRLLHTVGARFPLDRIVEAHEAVEAGRTLGNVVIDLN
jgi:NADPH2:quinone reductase